MVIIEILFEVLRSLAMISCYFVMRVVFLTFYPMYLIINILNGSIRSSRDYIKFNASYIVLINNIDKIGDSSIIELAAEKSENLAPNVLNKDHYSNMKLIIKLIINLILILAVISSPIIFIFIEVSTEIKDIYNDYIE